MAIIETLAIVSGGMDSVTMLHYLVKKQRLKPAVLSFTYGQKHVREIECARYQANLLGCEIHQVVDLSFLAAAFARSALVSTNVAVPTIDMVEGDSQPATYVPFRNTIFLSIAAAFAETLGLREVCYGAQAHDLYGYWDTTPEYQERINSLFSLDRKSQIQVNAPLVRYSKTEVLLLGLELGVDYSQTCACYEGNQLACGKCPTCAERLQAFRNVGMEDPLTYIN
jgi:7-cyano-7-deazaguanine synthase